MELLQNVIDDGDIMAKKILISGGGGFIAHHLINQVLQRTDWDIVTVDRLDYSGNLNR